MYNHQDIISLLAANVRATKSPFGIPKPLVNTWWKGQGLGREGDVLLMTGLMYQLVPYIETVTRQLERFEDTRFMPYLAWARFVPKLLSGLGLAALTPAPAKDKAALHLRDIVAALRASGVSFGYRPELDEYSGILLYDLGDQESFVRHARLVAERLAQAGVRRIITVDPHTTYALKVLYPRYVGAQFEVRTYFEALDMGTGGGAVASPDAGGARLTLHDPCFYGRYLELSDLPRRLLGGLGHQCADVRECGAYTSCCGGPAEAVSPRLSARIGAGRAGQLAATGEQLVTMCPICLSNLEKAGANVLDLSAILARGLPRREPDQAAGPGQ